jgi:hypothetical protein
MAQAAAKRRDPARGGRGLGVDQRPEDRDPEECDAPLGLVVHSRGRTGTRPPRRVGPGGSDRWDAPSDRLIVGHIRRTREAGRWSNTASVPKPLSKARTKARGAGVHWAVLDKLARFVAGDSEGPPDAPAA